MDMFYEVLIIIQVKDLESASLCGFLICGSKDFVLLKSRSPYLTRRLLYGVMSASCLFRGLCLSYEDAFKETAILVFFLLRLLSGS